MTEPIPFETFRPGVYLHGTKAELSPGELLVAGRESNFEDGRTMNYVYFTATLDAATWGAELAAGDGVGWLAGDAAAPVSVAACGPGAASLLLLTLPA